MQFLTLACLASTALAGVAPRDATVVLGVLSSVQDKVEGITSAAKAYTGGKPTAALNAADELVSTLQSSVSKVKSSGDLDITDSVKLAGPVQDLTSAAQDLVSTLEAKRSLVESAGECGEVRDAVNSVNSNSQSLINAVLAKVTDDTVKPVAQKLVAPLKTVLAKAVSDYSTSNCKGGSSSGSSSTSAAGSSSTEAASTTATETSAAATTTVAVVTTPAGTPTAVVTTTSVATTVPTAAAAAFAPAGVLALAAAVLAL